MLKNFQEFKNSLLLAESRQVTNSPAFSIREKNPGDVIEVEGVPVKITEFTSWIKNKEAKCITFNGELEDGTEIKDKYDDGSDGYVFDDRTDMEDSPLPESFHNEKTLIFGHTRSGRNITVTLKGGRIESIDNKAMMRFPFSVGQNYNRSMETWACNNGFKINDEDPCPEEKIFGIRKKDIPQGHELRIMFPGKFRK